MYHIQPSVGSGAPNIDPYAYMGNIFTHRAMSLIPRIHSYLDVPHVLVRRLAESAVSVGVRKVPLNGEWLCMYMIQNFNKTSHLASLL